MHVVLYLSMMRIHMYMSEVLAGHGSGAQSLVVIVSEEQGLVDSLWSN